MELTDHLAGTAMRSVQIHFAAEVAQVQLGAVVVLGDDLVAGAVVAQRLAKRDVHIQRQRQRFGSGAQAALFQRKHIVILAKRLDKPVSGGVGGIAGPWHVKTAQKIGRYSSHGRISLRTP